MSAKSGPGGRIVSFNLTVKNRGPGIAHLVTLTDPLPDQVEYLNASGGTRYGNVVVWGVGNMRPKGVATLIIVTRRVLPGVIFRNFASVTSSSSDRNSRNNTCGVTVALGQ